MKDWPGLIEIKGRVRLDAFEKFLQELRLSKTRAIMVPHVSSCSCCILSVYITVASERDATERSKFMFQFDDSFFHYKFLLCNNVTTWLTLFICILSFFDKIKEDVECLMVFITSDSSFEGGQDVYISSYDVRSYKKKNLIVVMDEEIEC